MHEPDTVTAPPPSRSSMPPKSEAAYRPGAKWAAALMAAGCAALLLLISLIVLWLGQTSARVYTEGADALVIRAVLRADTDPVATEKLAIHIRQHVPDAEIEIINEAMGRSLLALQEPWIAQMPDFEVTPLPVLLEIRHPELLTHPEKVSEFIDNLKAQPEVDLVAYNETAHDRLVKLAGSARDIESHTLRWLVAAIALAGILISVAWALIAPYRSITGVLTAAVIIWACAWAVAWLLYRGWESAAVETGNWERLDASTHFQVGVAALFIILVATILGRLTARLRP